MTPDLLRLAATANLAPSVHNTQPTRWSLADDGAVWLRADLSRQLAVGDAAGRDLCVSLGAALEATVLALGQQEIGVGAIDVPDGPPAARVALYRTGSIEPLTAQMPRRLTWRRRFAEASMRSTQALAGWATAQPDITLVWGSADIDAISALNERTSLIFYRNAPYRRELLSWMRLSPSDPRFGVDGLSAPALGMSGVEAFGAGIVLSDAVFGLLDGVGLVAPLISERTRTRSASAVLLFHRPAEENPIETGRALYRRQLELSALGFETWPMSVLADNPDSAAELSARFRIDAGRRLITAWRVGALPVGATVRRERLPAQALIAA
jgi:nitroreductase